MVIYSEVFATVTDGGIGLAKLHVAIDSVRADLGSNTRRTEPGFAYSFERTVENLKSFINICFRNI